MSAAFQSVTCTTSSEYINATKGGNQNVFLVVDGDTIRITNQRTINSSTEPGYAGEICYDANYFYICVAEDSWRRVPHQSF